jgi:ribosomal protein S18 acetylase RimI-like enzyme
LKPGKFQELMLIIKELKDLNKNEINSLRMLLMDYGHYMYAELQLISGKDSYSSEMSAFPAPKHSDADSAFLLALYNDVPAGCVGLRKFNPDSCEMKRMYVNPIFRGLKIGEKLCEEIINVAKMLGYKKMLLDTNKEMNAAVDLYLKFDFVEIPPYCVNENQNPVFLEKKL